MSNTILLFLVRFYFFCWTIASYQSLEAMNPVIKLPQNNTRIEISACLAPENFVYLPDSHGVRAYATITVVKPAEYVCSHNKRKSCADIFSPQLLPIELIQKQGHIVLTMIQMGLVANQAYDDNKSLSWTFTHENLFIPKQRIDSAAQEYVTKKNHFIPESCSFYPVTMYLSAPDNQSIESFYQEFCSRDAELKNAQCLNNHLPLSKKLRRRTIKNGLATRTFKKNIINTTIEHGDNHTIEQSNIQKIKRIYNPFLLTSSDNQELTTQDLSVYLADREHGHIRKKRRISLTTNHKFL